MSSKLKIGLLVAGHVVVTPLVAWNLHDLYYTAASFRPLDVALNALIFAEAGLLAIWGAVGTTRTSWCIPVVVAATAHLCVLRLATFNLLWAHWTFVAPFSSEVALPMVVVLFVLSRLRHGQRGLRLAQSVSLAPTAEVNQFTIRHLLITTAAAAVVLAIGRGLRALTTIGWSNLLFGVVLQTSYLSLVELATFWAILGAGRTTHRLAMVVPTVVVAGAIMVFWLYTIGVLDWRTLTTWSAIIGFQATITAASLLVVRSCGWWLVRGANLVAEQP